MTKQTQRFLWPEAIQCANVIYNITSHDNTTTLLERYTGLKSKLYDHLVQFGRTGFVTIHWKIKTNWDTKADKMVVVGYGSDQAWDTYQFYNPKTRKIIESRDV